MSGQQPRRTSSLTEALAEEIRALTGARRIKQTEMAKRSGIPYGTYRRIENGDRPPDSWQIQMIAQALGMPPSELWRRAEDRVEDAEGEGERRSG